MGQGRVEFRFLGPVVVTVGAVPVDLSAKERALVAAVGLACGRVVSVDRLIEALWGDAAPETAPVSVRVHVSRIRRRLADAGADGRLVTRGSGYALVLEDSDRVDVAEFGALTATAAQAAAAGHHDAAADLFAAALALWRGEALAELGDGAFFRGTLTRLEEDRLAAVEGRVEADLECGRHTAVVGELESLCTDHPLRERFWFQRMVALYRCGRQADALRAYQDLRSHLREELGLEPSTELNRLEARILGQDPALTWAPQRSPRDRGSDALPSGVVSFLLTDVEGSTTLWDADPETAAVAFARHDEIVQEVIAAHQGILLKAKGEGDATLSVFHRASEAVGASVVLQRTIDTEPWPAGAMIRVRIAIHSGEAHERDGDYFGPTANRAARIRALAAGGETLVSQATAELIRDHMPDDVALLELGAHRLAGVSRPEQVFSVCARDPLGEDAGIGHMPLIPLPAALDPAGGFVGRSAELGTLSAAWARARSAQRGVLLVAGEPGIGKTSLVAEWARSAHAEGAVVLFGRCDEEMLVPFQPFVEALAHWVMSSPIGEVRGALGPQAADLALLVPEVRHRVPGLAEPTGGDTATDRYRLFEAVPALLRAIALTAPLVVVIDDLHWADRTTLQLLTHTIRRSAGIRLLVLGTYRDTEICRTHPLADTLGDLRRADAMQRLALRGLSREEVGELISPSDEFGRESAALAEVLWRDTDGSPLFVRESLRHLTEVGAVAADEHGRWRPVTSVKTFGIPEGIKDVIGRRLTRLSDDANTVLRNAAVNGRQFDPAVAAAVSDLPLDSVLDCLDEASTAGIVREVGGQAARYEFTHALVRDALYDELSASRRVRLHQRVGDAIEAMHAADLDAHLAELAYHFSQAAVAGLADKAIDYARRAGDRAMAGVAYEEASRLFAVALEAAEDAGASDETRAELLLRHGEAHWRAGSHKAAKATLEKAAELARRSRDAERLGRAALLYAGAGIRWVWLTVATVDDRVVDLLEEALAVLDSSDNPLRARLLGCLAAELHFRPGASARCDELSREAVAMARRCADTATLAYVLSARNFAVLGVPTAEERLANAEESLELAGKLGDKTLAAFSHGGRFMALHDLDRMDAAKDAVEAAALLGAELRDPFFAQFDLFCTANWARLEGRFDEAERIHREAFMLGQEAGDRSAMQGFFGPMCEVRRLQGRLREVTPALEAFGEAFPVLADIKEVFLAWFLGEARAPDAGRHLLGVDREQAFPRMAEFLPLCGLARVVFRRRDADHAAWMYTRLRPHVAKNPTMGGNVCNGTVSHAVGLLAAVLDRPDEAARWLEDALRRYDINGWAAPHAEATGQLAAIIATTDHPRAERLAEQALADATQMGMRQVAEDAADLLACLRGEPRRARARGADPVTRRDRLRGKLTTRGRELVSRLVEGASDEELSRRFGSVLAQRAVFGGMAKAFQPSMAFGFEGELSFELRAPNGNGSRFTSEWWTIAVHGRRATAHHGCGSSPAVTIHIDLLDFIRMSAGHPALDAVMDGRIQIEGDPMLLVRASVMFGGVEPFDLVDAPGSQPAE